METSPRVENVADINACMWLCKWSVEREDWPGPSFVVSDPMPSCSRAHISQKCNCLSHCCVSLFWKLTLRVDIPALCGNRWVAHQRHENIFLYHVSGPFLKETRQLEEQRTTVAAESRSRWGDYYWTSSSQKAQSCLIFFITGAECLSLFVSWASLWCFAMFLGS